MSLEATKDREIKRDTRTGIYQYRGTPIRGGREITRSLGVRTFNAAVSVKKDLLLKLRGIDPNARDLLFSDAVKVLLEERKRRAPATFEQAFYCCQALLPFFEHYTLRQITDRAWDEYKEYQAQLKPGRLLRYDKRHLKMMLLRAKNKGLVSEIPELPLDDPEAKRKRVLTPDEIRAIFEHAQGSCYGLALFMYKMGPRTDEPLGAPWDEFNLNKGIWSIAGDREKRRISRTIKLNSQVWDWLKARRAEDPKGVWVFPSRGSDGLARVGRIHKQWKRLMERSGVDTEITPYYLRHTFLTECAKKVRQGEMSLVLITKYAGTSIKEFERTYLHVEGEETKAVAELMEMPE